MLFICEIKVSNKIPLRLFIILCGNIFSKESNLSFFVFI